MSGLVDSSPYIQGATDDTYIGNASDSLKTKVTNSTGADAVPIQDGGNSITIDAVSLPLPTGAATAANQVTANTSLASIDAGIPAALGQTTMANSMPVTMASNQTAIPVTIQTLPSSSVQAWSNKLRVLDMNVSNGGVARGTSITNSAWVDVYSYTGSGYLAGFILNLETFIDWLVRLTIDGQEIIISSDGIISDEITADTIYDLDDVTDINQAALGISKGSHDRLVFTPPLNIPIYFASSISIKVKRVATKASKKFQAGLIWISKET